MKRKKKKVEGNEEAEMQVDSRAEVFSEPPVDYVAALCKRACDVHPDTHWVWYKECIISQGLLFFHFLPFCCCNNHHKTIFLFLQREKKKMKWRIAKKSHEKKEKKNQQPVYEREV